MLFTIVMNAVRMSGADGGSIMQYVEQESSFSVRTTYGTSDERAQRVLLDESSAALVESPMQV